MSTRYARELGTARHLNANGRKWTVERSEGRRMLAELHRTIYGGLSFFPGMWAGQPRLGFSALENAGYWRRRALNDRSGLNRMIFKNRAHEALETSRAMRIAHEMMIASRTACAEAAQFLQAAE